MIFRQHLASQIRRAVRHLGGNAAVISENNVITTTEKAISYALLGSLSAIAVAAYSSPATASNTQSSSTEQPQNFNKHPPPPTSNENTAQWRVFTDMGRDMASQRRFQEAENFLLKALDAARKGFGDDSPHLASAKNNLAELYRLTHQYEKAAPLYEESIKILAQNYGGQDIRVAFALHNLGGFYFGQKQYDNASKYYEQALQVKMSSIGPGHAETINTLFHLAEVRWAQNRRSEALQFARQAIDAIDVMNGSDSAALRRRSRYAEMLLATNKYEEAEKQLRRNLAVIEENQGGNAPGVAAAAENLALALHGAKKHDEALMSLQRSLDIKRKALKGQNNSLSVVVTLRRLAEVRLQILQSDNNNKRPAETASIQLDALNAAQEACQIATGIYSNSSPLPTRHDKDAAQQQQEESSKGLVDKFLSSLKPESNDEKLRKTMQRPIRWETAALELAECLKVLALVQNAVGESSQAAHSLNQAYHLLHDEWNQNKAAVKSDSTSDDSSERKIQAKYDDARRKIVCGILQELLGIVSDEKNATKNNNDDEHHEHVKEYLKSYEC